jgi:hypothetical protein
MNLPIEIVEQSEQSPRFDILAMFPGVEAHRGFHAQHVSDQAFIFHKFTHNG